MGARKRRRHDRDFIEAQCSFCNQTADGLLVAQGKKRLWLPKSQIIVNEADDLLKIRMPFWLAKKKGVKIL